MKRISASAVVLSAILSWSPGLFAQTAPDGPKLLGIVKLPTHTCAVLEFPILRTGNPKLRESAVLSPGERRDELELLSVTPETHRAEVLFGGNQITLYLGGTTSWSATNSVEITNAPLRVTLQLLSEISKRNLLLHPALPDSKMAIRADATESESLKRIFVQAFADHGIATIKDGDKFLMIVPTNLVDSVKPGSDRLSNLLLPTRSTEEIPPGMINLSGADVWQLASTCSGIFDRRFIWDNFEKTRTPPALAKPVYFRNQTPITPAEFVYAMDTLIAWRGYKFETGETNVIRLVPTKTN